MLARRALRRQDDDLDSGRDHLARPSPGGQCDAARASQRRTSLVGHTRRRCAVAPQVAASGDETTKYLNTTWQSRRGLGRSAPETACAAHSYMTPARVGASSTTPPESTVCAGVIARSLSPRGLGGAPVRRLETSVATPGPPRPARVVPPPPMRFAADPRIQSRARAGVPRLLHTSRGSSPRVRRSSPARTGRESKPRATPEAAPTPPPGLDPRGRRKETSAGTEFSHIRSGSHDRTAHWPAHEVREWPARKQLRWGPAWPRRNASASARAQVAHRRCA